MTRLIELKRLVSEKLPPQLRRWLWERKVAIGNRRIRELGRQLSHHIHKAAEKDFASSEHISTKAEWELFHHVRIDALHRSLGVSQAHSDAPNSIVTSTLERDTYQIDNVVFQGHMNVPITANCYSPIRLVPKTPAIVICHSHHDSKTEEELQCMGMTFAQQGCTVLIMDLLGHGERRQHPFKAKDDYVGSFLVDRQDYYFRSVLGMQLDLVGESLMGWMVEDVRRGLDLLWADPQVDRDRIIVIGAVAGGGDIAASVGAVDDRVAAVVAFNFGQLSIGDWDSTRNLFNTVRGGFWPWVILGSRAPRLLVYGREFSWDSEQDFVWQRLKKIYDFYDSPEALRSICGSGRVSGHGPLDSHCMNVGPIHRRQLYPIFQEWFGIPIPDEEIIEPVRKEKLQCLTGEAGKMFSVRLVHEITGAMSQKHLAAARHSKESLETSTRVVFLQQQLGEVLGSVTPVTTYRVQTERHGIGRSEYVVLEVEDNISVRLQLFRPFVSGHAKLPVVIGFAQEGNHGLRREHRRLIQHLQEQGVVVCLTELRGLGDGRHGELYRGRISPSSGIATMSLMMGDSLLASRIRDLRTVMAYLRGREDMDCQRVALWGDSLAATNSFRDNLIVPLDSSPYPLRGEPLGGATALLTALYEPQVQAVYIHGGLSSYAALLDNFCVYQPMDCIVRGLLRIADLSDVAEALAPRPLRMEGLVDGWNRPVSRPAIEDTYHAVRSAYARAERAEYLSIQVERGSAETIAQWFLTYLR